MAVSSVSVCVVLQRLLAVVLCALVHGGSVSAQETVEGMVDASDASRLAEAIRAHGYRAELATDGAGDPMIRTGADGLDYAIYFFGCVDGAACRNVLLRIGFDLPSGSTLAVVNDWNRDNLMGRAFIDAEGDPYVEHFVALEGGVTVANLGSTLRWWSVAISDFRKAIGF